MVSKKSVGEFFGWIEQETSIQLKACTRLGDPIEVSAEEAREIARMLLKLADELEELDR